MRDSGKNLPSLVKAVTLVLPLIDPKRGKAAVAAVEALRQLVEEAKGFAAGPRDAESLAALREKVDAHAEAASGRLRARE